MNRAWWDECGERRCVHACEGVRLRVSGRLRWESEKTQKRLMWVLGGTRHSVLTLSSNLCIADSEGLFNNDGQVFSQQNKGTDSGSLVLRTNQGKADSTCMHSMIAAAGWWCMVCLVDLRSWEVGIAWVSSQAGASCDSCKWFCLLKSRKIEDRQKENCWNS